jgi:hypothetical protein
MRAISLLMGLAVSHKMFGKGQGTQVVMTWCVSGRTKPGKNLIKHPNGDSEFLGHVAMQENESRLCS